MPYFIIIRGPLGCGKSTIAKKLAEDLNGKHISIDIVLEKEGLDNVDKNIGCVPPENFIKAIEKIIHNVMEKLNKDKIVIFDACFYHKETIEYLIQKLKYPNYIFTLKASIETCIERDIKRERKYGKEAVKAVHKLVSKFDYGTIINTNNQTKEETIKRIKSYLPK